MEVKFVKDGLDRFTIDNKIKLMTKGGDMWISRVELRLLIRNLY
jgi:hypothetical protein